MRFGYGDPLIFRALVERLFSSAPEFRHAVLRHYHGRMVSHKGYLPHDQAEALILNALGAWQPAEHDELVWRLEFEYRRLTRPTNPRKNEPRPQSQRKRK